MARYIKRLEDGKVAEIADSAQADVLLTQRDRFEEVPAPAKTDEGVLGSLQAGAVGALQGATFDKTDELIGLLSEDAAKKFREKEEALKEEHPYSYHGGQLAGGFAVPIPGLGVAKGAKAAVMAGKAAKEAGLLRKILAGTGEVVGQGIEAAATNIASQALERSKGDYDREETLSSGKSGLVVGAGVGALGKGASGLAHALGKTGAGEAAKTAYKYGKEGFDVTNKEQVSELVGEIGETGKTMADALNLTSRDAGQSTLFKKAGESRKRALSSTQLSTSPVNTPSVITASKVEDLAAMADRPGVIKNADVKAFLSLLNRSSKEQMTPSELAELRRNGEMVIERLRGDQNADALSFKSGVSDALKTVDNLLVEHAPDYSAASKRMNEVSNLHNQLIAGKEEVEKGLQGQPYWKSASDPETRADALAAYSKMIGSASTKDVMAPGKRTMELLKQKLTALKSDPVLSVEAKDEIAKLDALLNKSDELADKLGISRIASTHIDQSPTEPISDALFKGMGLGSFKPGIGAPSAASLGATAAKAEKTAANSAVLNTLKSVFDGPAEVIPATMNKLATAMEQNPQFSKYAAIARAAGDAANPDSQMKRRQFIFMASQNPTLKSFVESMLGPSESPAK